MDKNKDFEHTFALGKRALGYIKYNETPAIPENYELWYEFASGHNKALVSAIQEILEKNSRLSPEDAQQIFDQFISPNRLSEQAEVIGTQVNNEIREIVGMLKTASESTGKYGETLTKAGEELNEINDSGDLKKIVAKLVNETATMTSTNKMMEQQLESARSQITELNASLESVRQESITDQLTGISNRKHFDEVLQAAMTQAREDETPLCLLITDIDHFKKFNDTYGHQTGDQVLRLVAHTLKANVKGKDLAARYGGEEFGIILPDTKLDSAVLLADSVRSAVMKRELIKKSTNMSLGYVTLSIGVAQYRPGESGDELIHRADACLYAAKGAGRNQVKSETDPDVNLSINAA